MLGFVSCDRYALMDKVPVEYKRPANTAFVACDVTFHLNDSVILAPERLQIVSDSILVVKQQVDDALTFFFSAYSLHTYKYLGSFLSKGRGPGEMLSPYMTALSSSLPYLFIRDNSLMLSCELDVMNSIKTGSGVFAKTFPSTDPGPIWFPVGDSLFFSYERKGKELYYKILTATGEDYKSFSPFHGLDLDKYFTQMSEIPTSDGTNGKLAFPMVFFPMLHFLDVESGHWLAIAVDPDWRNWKTLLKEPMSLEKMGYYAGATSSAKYAIALYQKRHLGGNEESGTGSEIHFFDWDGNFSYRIKVVDDLIGLTFDSINSYLYGIERATGKIVRYDLSSILLPTNYMN